MVPFSLRLLAKQIIIKVFDKCSTGWSGYQGRTGWLVRGFDRTSSFRLSFLLKKKENYRGKIEFSKSFQFSAITIKIKISWLNFQIWSSFEEKSKSWFQILHSVSLLLFESVNRFVTNNESVKSSARSLVRLLVRNSERKRERKETSPRREVDFLKNGKVEETRENCSEKMFLGYFN